MNSYQELMLACITDAIEQYNMAKASQSITVLPSTLYMILGINAQRAVMLRNLKYPESEHWCEAIFRDDCECLCETLMSFREDG